MKPAARGLVCAVLLSGLAACAPAGGPPSLRVGFIAPLSGPMAPLGTSCLEGANLAIDEINRGGGLRIGGRRCRVELILEDCQDRPELAVSAVQDLINRRDASAVIGPPMSGLAIPAARMASEAGIPLITQYSTHPDVTVGTRGVWRVCYTDALQGRALAAFAREHLRGKTAAVLFDIAGTFSREIAGIFRDRFEEMGGRIVAWEPYTTGREDFREPLLSIRSARPDILFLPDYLYQIRMQAAQIRQLGLQFRILGSDAMFFRDPQDVALIEGAWSSTHFSADDPGERVRSFDAAYRAAFQRPATPGGALTYDAFQLLFQAARAARSVQPDRIAAGLAATRELVGVTGTMRFDGRPDPVKGLVMLHVEGGAYRFAARIGP